MDRKQLCRSLVVALLAINCTVGNIIQYENVPIENDEYGSYVVSHKVGMYTPEDSPEGEYQSFVHMNLDFERESAEKQGYVEILLLHETSYETVGFMLEDGSVEYCCSQELFDDKKCNSVGHAIYEPDTPLVRRILVNFNSDVAKTHLDYKYIIEKSGYHYVFYTNCNKDTSDVIMNGASEWKNPYGYLPGQFYQLLSFYGWLAIAYLCLGIGWMFLSAIYWKDLTKLQMYIAALIVLGMAETATVYFFWEEQNNSGRVDLVAEVLSTLFNVMKRSLSRLLVLVVSMGYGVVRPTLGSNSYKVLLFGLVYFLFSGLLEVIENMNMSNEISSAVRLMFTVPVAALDAAFLWAIFYSLTRTIANLTIRRQSAKLELYKIFHKVIVGSVGLSVCCAIIQIAAELQGDSSETWETYWVIRVYWQVVYLIVLTSIVVLWRPCENNLRYSYMEDFNDRDEIEEDLQPSGLDSKGRVLESSVISRMSGQQRLHEDPEALRPMLGPNKLE